MYYIKREKYLDQLIRRKENGMIKVITGIRRCGKSFLLFNIYRDYLISSGVKEGQIITLALDDRANIKYRDPDVLYDYIRSKITNDTDMFYIFIDEVQYAIARDEMKNDVTIGLYDVLNGLMHIKNADVYVTGSNSKMLTKDVLTAFRGRGDAVAVHPLSFKEYYDYVGGDRAEVYEEYALYGGMPAVISKGTPAEKRSYLGSLFEEIYFKDIIERYRIDLPEVLSEVTDDLCSSVGSLTNATKIAHALSSAKGIKVSGNTVSLYLEYLAESFLFSCAKRYDVKGKRYFSFPSKYYCADIGLRNVRLNLRQQEETHIMENIVYNELIARGFAVDVGVVDIYDTDDAAHRHKKACEIDFVVNNGMHRYYIQSALSISDEQKARQEMRPLLATKDFFKKIVITKTRMKPWIDDNGIIHVGLYDFILNEDILDL